MLDRKILGWEITRPGAVVGSQEGRSKNKEEKPCGHSWLQILFSRLVRSKSDAGFFSGDDKKYSVHGGGGGKKIKKENCRIPG